MPRGSSDVVSNQHLWCVLGDSILASTITSIIVMMLVLYVHILNAVSMNTSKLYRNTFCIAYVN